MDYVIYNGKTYLEVSELENQLVDDVSDMKSRIEELERIVDAMKNTGILMDLT